MENKNLFAAIFLLPSLKYKIKQVLVTAFQITKQAFP
jgi:hypothetical protein